MTSWKLKRTHQCEKCPWRKDVDPFDIPNGYDVEKHHALKETIADGPDPTALFDDRALRIMACHETQEAHCVGWLNHQLGPGNNLLLRLQMRDCENAHAIRLRGDQHETFEDTLPEGDE